MADLTPFLLSFPPDAGFKTAGEYDRVVRSFVQNVSQQSQTALAKAAEGPNGLLSLLDPSVNTISYLAVLLAVIQVHVERSKSPKTVPDNVRPGSQVWGAIVKFLAVFDPIQVRYVGGDWRRLVEFVDRVARLSDEPMSGLAPIYTAITRLEPSLSTLTSSHLLYLRLCLETRAYRQAVPILDHQIQAFPTTLTGSVESILPAAEPSVRISCVTAKSNLTAQLTPHDVGEYFLLGAMCYIGARMFKDALLYLEHVLVAPTAHVASGYQVEAYRKWVLVSCLIGGAPKSLPRSSNTTAMKTVKATSRAYDAIADAFRAVDMRKLEAEISAGASIWLEDGNYGLVQEVLRHLPRVFVINLQKTYAAVQVERVAQWLEMPPQQAEAYLASLIGEGYVNAVIEQSSATDGEPSLSVLRFYEDPTSGPLAKSEGQQYKELLEQTDRINVLSEQVKLADLRLSLRKEYIESLRRKKKKEEQGGEEAMDTSWDPAEADEDIMGDMS